MYSWLAPATASIPLLVGVYELPAAYIVVFSFILFARRILSPPVQQKEKHNVELNLVEKSYSFVAERGFFLVFASLLFNVKGVSQRKIPFNDEVFKITVY